MMGLPHLLPSYTFPQIKKINQKSVSPLESNTISAFTVTKKLKPMQKIISSEALLEKNKWPKWVMGTALNSAHTENCLYRKESNRGKYLWLSFSVSVSLRTSDCLTVIHPIKK